MRRLPAFLLRPALTGGLLFCFAPAGLHAQAPSAQAPAAAGTRVLGTVKAISAGVVTVSKDDGSVATVTLADGVRVQQLAAGSTDMKTAQPASPTDIAEGDRVLIVARPGDAGTLNATRVVLMKSDAIAASNAGRQADWQRRGTGGIVTAVDPAAKTITITSGTRKSTVQTSDRTVFRRYAPGSVRFEDAKIGTVSDIAVGDQLRVRGSRDVDSGAIAAEEVVSGAFRNLAGTVVSVDASANRLVLKDLASKQNVTIAVTPSTDLRDLPAETAARFTRREPGAIHGASPSGSAGGQAPPPRPTGGAGGTSSEAAAVPPRVPAARSSGSADLAQLVPHLPPTTLSALKPGQALLVAGSVGATPSAPLTAITLLSGVEPLLAASPQGGTGYTLSPWNMGSGGDTGATP